MTGELRRGAAGLAGPTGLSLLFSRSGGFLPPPRLIPCAVSGREVAQRCPFPQGLRFLSVPPREQVSACVSILERLLQALDPLYVIQNLREELQKGLFHPDDSVKILTMSQVQGFFQEEGTQLCGELWVSPHLLFPASVCDKSRNCVLPRSCHVG